MADTFDISALVKDATAGQDTSLDASVKISSGTAAKAKSESGVFA